MTMSTIPEHDLDMHYSLHPACLESAAGETGNSPKSPFVPLFLTLRVVDLFSEGEAGPTIIAQVRRVWEVLSRSETDFKDEMLRVLETAEIAAETNSTGSLWPAVITLGRALEAELNLEEAIDVFDTVLRLPGTSTYRALAHVRKARTLRLGGRLGASADEYKVAIAISDEYGDKATGIMASQGLGLTYTRSGDLPRAETVLLDAMPEAVAIGSDELKAGIHHNLAMVYSQGGDHARAILELEKAYNLHTDERRVLRVVSDMGMVFKDLQHYQAARDCFEVVLAGAITKEMQINAELELAELAACVSDRNMFDRMVYQLTEDPLPPDATVDFHIKTGMGFAMFGDRTAAIAHLRSAVEKAENARLNAYLFRAESELQRVLDDGYLPTPADEFDESNVPAEVRRVSDTMKRVRASV